jgi:hypothetical protein
VTPDEEIQEPASHRRIRLTVWGVALVTALFAIAQTTANLALLRSEPTSANLAKAERRLLNPALAWDWQWLLKSGQPAGTTVSEWLDTVELSNLQRRQFYEALPEGLFRDHVLSPQLMLGQKLTGGLRRELWRHFAPRVRKEAGVTGAAVLIARELRTRVTPRTTANASTLRPAWQRGEAHPIEWEALFIAALRSAGIAARVGEGGQAEIWVDSGWQAAPRPLSY